MQSSRYSGIMSIKSVVFGAMLGLVAVGAASAIELKGSASVNVTSDTAAAAKNMAFDEARRQIIVDVLRQYADVGALRGAVSGAKSSELTELITASSIDGEQLSDTTYSAKISMTVDADAARMWLGANGVQNWVPDGSQRDVFVVNVQMSDAIANWMDLNRIARNEKLDLGTKYMSGNSAVLELPVSARGAFTIALREAGWRYANQDGALRIWK